MNKLFKVLLIILIVVIAGVGSLFFYFKSQIVKPLEGTQETKKLFEVRKGETTVDVSRKLKDYSVIGSDLAFVVEAKLKKGSILPGVYEVSPGYSIREIYQMLSTGETKVEKVTIPEGYRVEQIAQVLADKNLVDFQKFVDQAKPFEGQLFPDTYYFNPDDGEEKILSEMKADYTSRIAGLAVDNKILIVASIVEREAIKDEERALIAGVYMNRLKIGMKLEADPTVQYARDNSSIKSGELARDFKFWTPAVKADYNLDSKYNTYKYEGLPLGPICNPGIKSIEAAVDYQKHDYYFFIQHDGNIYPAKIFAEHQSNIAKYLK